VKKFLQDGALVAACGRKDAALAALSGECGTDRLFTFKADVSVETDCRAFIDAVQGRFGRIDLLINNAGISMRALFKDLDNLDVIRRLMDINFWGTVYCTH
jgi:NAD(P)-dependent dehydrogenase (short-subunit alcohol dehydrogenase family)